MTKKTKKSAADKAPLIKASEFATPERMRQEGGVSIEAVDRDAKGGVVQVRQRAKITCKLDWYLNAGTITEDMWKAGCRFTFYFFCAGKLPRTTPMYGDFVSGRRGQDPFASKTDYQIRLEKALEVLTPQEQDVIWDVCGNDQYAGTPARTRALLTGLRALAVLWAITNQT
ncbi:hypothetical protein [Micavibrio aeruginosavorus]|uniref:Uncharacterized protein n=1 Tax=Micavibrio aeruginosavorus (strain ARL-13) TaxID=856793 RepID=G2KMX2_MICAA|nr:hypothetical protein [Micavibrio aeruginosavorus]AEP08904.1 hypothetical protein MICA_567 [Micavibrio aeruginosavorus ARL-13]